MSCKVQIIFGLFFVVTLLSAGCVPPPMVREDRAPKEVAPPDVVQKQYERALDEYRQERWERAAQLFEDFISQYPKTTLTDDALYHLGTIHLGQKQYGEAAIQFETLLQYFPSSPQQKETQWLLAKCYFNLKRYEDALRTARRLFALVEDDPSWRGRLFGLFGECHAAMSNPMVALSWYVRAYKELPPAEQQSVRKHIFALLDQDFPVDMYREMEIMFGDSFIGTYVRYKLAQRYASENRFDEAAKVIRGVLDEAAGQDFFPLVEDLWKEISRAIQQEVLIGCILPLKGEYEPFGTKALRGIQLAMGAYQPERWPFKVRLIIWDSQGNPFLAQEGVRTLIEQEGVIAIIGPLLSNTALAAAEEAERFQVPLITLSPMRGISQTGAYVFQNSLSYDSQVRVLAQYSVVSLGLYTYAILYPRNAYGQMFRRLFHQEIESYGARLLRAVSYSDDQTDFGDMIKEMVDYEPASSPDEKPKPIIDFEAIFIPDDINKINLLVPQLAFYDITGVQLLGTSGWHAPDLVRDSGQFVEGAIFVDGFFHGSLFPWVQEFVSEFQSTFDHVPGLLEALSYDSTTVLLTAVRDKGSWSSRGIRDSLLSTIDYTGVSGLESFTADGQAVRRLFLLTVRHGKIEQIVPSE